MNGRKLSSVTILQMNVRGELIAIFSAEIVLNEITQYYQAAFHNVDTHSRRRAYQTVISPHTKQSVWARDYAKGPTTSSPSD